MRKRMSNMKKRMVAVGMAVAMTLGMVVPAQARTIREASAVRWEYNSDETANVEMSYLNSSNWYGSYDVAYGGKEYQLMICPDPDSQTQWYVEAFCWGDENDFADASWSGWFSWSSAYDLSIQNDSGQIFAIANKNHENMQDPDIILCAGTDSSTGQIYITAIPSTTHSLRNRMASANVTGISGEAAFPPIDLNTGDPLAIYKKVSDAYKVLVYIPVENGNLVGYDGWTTNGTDRVPEPWWSHATTSTGDGVG